MNNGLGKTKSPLEAYLKLVDQLFNKKLALSALKSSYPGSDFHPLQSLQGLKDQLAHDSFTSDYPEKISSVQDVKANFVQERIKTVPSGKPEPLVPPITPIQPVMAEPLPSPIIKPLMPVSQPTSAPTDQSPPRLQAQEIIPEKQEPETTNHRLAEIPSKVTSVIEDKLKEYSGISETEFFNDTREDISLADEPMKIEVISPSVTVTEKSDDKPENLYEDIMEVTTVIEKEEEEKVKKLENLFDEALSDLSDLFSKKKGK
ncbi:MAG: hypothetical protein ACXAEU_02805 [Candidatus Hodarchaeales archaeon]